MTQHNKLKISVLAAALALAAVPLSYAYGAERPAAGKQHRVVGEKLDSGLGRLPHYRHWAKHPETQRLVTLASHVPGEKLDSGLGELPPYREWADNTGNQHLAAKESASK